MKKTALIIHGIGGHAGIHWQQWLHNQLQSNDFEVFMPSLSDPDHPDRLVWLNELVKITEMHDTSDLAIIGHSLGVTSALDFIEQSPQNVANLVCVSGIYRDYGSELNSYFLNERTIDFSKVKAKIKKSTVFYGDNDPYVTQTALKDLAKNLEVKAIVVPNGGHLNSDAGYIQFPELLRAIV